MNAFLQQHCTPIPVGGGWQLNEDFRRHEQLLEKLAEFGIEDGDGGTPLTRNAEWQPHVFGYLLLLQDKSGQYYKMDITLGVIDEIDV